MSMEPDLQAIVNSLPRDLLEMEGLVADYARQAVRTLFGGLNRGLERWIAEIDKIHCECGEAVQVEVPEDLRQEDHPAVSLGAIPTEKELPSNADQPASEQVSPETQVAIKSEQRTVASPTCSSRPPPSHSPGSRRGRPNSSRGGSRPPSSRRGSGFRSPIVRIPRDPHAHEEQRVKEMVDNEWDDDDNRDPEEMVKRYAALAQKQKYETSLYN